MSKITHYIKLLTLEDRWLERNHDSPFSEVVPEFHISTI